MRGCILQWSVAAMLGAVLAVCSPILPTWAVGNTWFTQGERLLFDVDWGWIQVGQAEILFDPTVSKEAEKKKTEGYNLTVRAWADVPFFTMRDRIRVEGQHTVDKLFEPVRYTTRQMENDYRAHKEILYTFQEQEPFATFENKHAGLKPLPFMVDTMGRDFLSTLYFLRQTRTEGLTVGDVITLPVIGMHRIFTLKLHVVGKEHIRSPYNGTQEVYRLEPVLHEIGGDEQVKADWALWVSTDGQYLPLQIDIRLNFGKVRAQLVDVGDVTSPSQAPEGLPLVGDVSLPKKKPVPHALPEEW